MKRAAWARRGDELQPRPALVQKQPRAENRPAVAKLSAALDAAVSTNEKLRALDGGLAFPALGERVEWWRSAALAELGDDGPKAA